MDSRQNGTMTGQDGTLRRVLLMETRDLHDELDRHVGAFSDRAEYAAFLAGSHAFRAAVEPQLVSMPEWPVQPLAALIRQDLADLGRPCPAPVPAAVLPNRVAQAGACYVLEGSALGARLLARRAAALGYGGDHGARHLAAQTCDRQRWTRFLDWLERADVPHPEAALAARGVFALALRAYGATVAA